MQLRKLTIFTRKHPDETLIVVTGDHETGGIKTAFTGGFSPENFIAAVKSQKISGSELENKTREWSENNISIEVALQKTIDYFGLETI